MMLSPAVRISKSVVKSVVFNRQVVKQPRLQEKMCSWGILEVPYVFKIKLIVRRNAVLCTIKL